MADILDMSEFGIESGIQDVIALLERDRTAVTLKWLYSMGLEPMDLLARGWTRHPIADIYLPPKIKEYVS